MEAAMIPMSGRPVTATRHPGFDVGYRVSRDWDERTTVHAGASGSERLSLAEQIEQTLLEAERLHGD
jgi:hypothetical protein